MAWLACGVPDVWLVTFSWFAIRRKASLTLFSSLCSYWFRSSVDVPKNYLFRSGKRNRYLGFAKGETRGDRRLETTPAVGLLRQRLTYDTFWRTFYAVLTTRSRIRDPSCLTRVPYLLNIGLLKEMKRLIYNAEYWILKLQSWFWFLKLNVGCSTGML